MYRNNSYMRHINRNNINTTYDSNMGYYDERGFWIPFVVGGLAGGALGYSIGNNNNYGPGPGPFMGPYPRPCCPPYPVPYYPYY